MTHDAYQEHVRNAVDVCSNCMRTVRVERVDPTRSGLNREYESYYARDEITTEIGYAPARSVTDQKGVFCTHCGTEHHDDRIWDDVDFADPELPLDEDRFRELAKNAMRSLEAKGVSIDRHAFATAALSAWDDHRPVDECLGDATEHAIVVAAMGNGRGHRRTVSAD